MPFWPRFDSPWVLAPGEFGFSLSPFQFFSWICSSFFLDLFLFLSSLHLLHWMGEVGPARVLETHLTMCKKWEGKLLWPHFHNVGEKVAVHCYIFALGSLALWGLVLWPYKGQDFSLGVNKKRRLFFALPSSPSLPPLTRSKKSSKKFSGFLLGPLLYKSCPV